MVRRSSATPTFLGISSAHAHCRAHYHRENNAHSHPQRLRSIWPAPWIETSVGTLCMGTYITYLPSSRSMALAKLVAASEDENECNKGKERNNRLHHRALSSFFPHA